MEPSLPTTSFKYKKRNATTTYIIEMQSFQIQIKRNPIKTIANTNYKGFDK